MFNKKFISLILGPFIAISSNAYPNFIYPQVFAAALIEEEEEEDNSELYDTILKFMNGIQALGAEITESEISEFGEDIEYWALKYINLFHDALCSTEDENAITLKSSLDVVLNNPEARKTLITCAISNVRSGDDIPGMHALLYFCQDIYTFGPEIIDLANSLISGISNQTDYAVCKAFVDTDKTLTPFILEYFSRLVRHQDLDLHNSDLMNEFITSQETLINYFLSLQDIGSDLSVNSLELSLALFDCYFQIERHFASQDDLFESLPDGTRVVKRPVLEAMMYIAGTRREDGSLQPITAITLEQLNSALEQ